MLIAMIYCSFLLNVFIYHTIRSEYRKKIAHFANVMSLFCFRLEVLLQTVRDEFQKKIGSARV